MVSSPDPGGLRGPLQYSLAVLLHKVLDDGLQPECELVRKWRVKQPWPANRNYGSLNSTQQYKESCSTFLRLGAAGGVRPSQKTEKPVKLSRQPRDCYLVSECILSTAPMSLARLTLL